jgi:hypothetical protein
MDSGKEVRFNVREHHCLPLLYGARRALYVVETTLSSKFESYSAHHLIENKSVNAIL